MKVFVTVGSMLPFDRLVAAMDTWASRHAEASVFAQIGDSSLRPTHLDFSEMISPADYRKRFEESDLVVSHVGMGTVITAFEIGKPLVMLPRRPDFQEVTSNHQIATAKWLDGRPGVHLVYDETAIAGAIEEAIGSTGVSRIDSGTRQSLIGALREFIAA